MKIKKFLKKAAEEDRESLIDEKDIEFLASVGVDYNKKIEEDKKQPPASYYLTAPAINRKTLLISATCFLLAVVALVLILYYSLRPSPVDPPLGYLDLNKEEIPSSLQELNEDLELFSLIADESEYEVSVRKTYDKLSGDSLFYGIDFNHKNGKVLRIEIVVNDKYEYKNAPYTQELQETQFNGYTLKYFQSSDSVSDSPFFEIFCQGELQIGKQWVYITSFTETVWGEQSTFIETLNSIIQFN